MASKKWKKIPNKTNYDNMLHSRNIYKTALSSAKKAHYISKVNHLSSDIGGLYSFLNKLLDRKSKVVHYPDIDRKELCSKFVSHFLNKIQSTCEIIKSKLSSNPYLPASSPLSYSINNLSTSLSLNKPNSPPSLSSFKLPSATDVYNMLILSKKGSSNNPLPLSVFKKILIVINPIIHNIICDSLSKGIFPDCYKRAYIIPILKKPSLNSDQLCNYRPISQLPIISKVIERIIFNQISQYMSDNKLHDPYQSAYRKGHSTETALNLVLDQIFNLLDDLSAVQLVLLDLTSSFDTISHDILILRLKEIGICDLCLSWLVDYLNDRTFSVLIGDTLSKPSNIN